MSVTRGDIWGVIWILAHDHHDIPEARQLRQ
jgi:hypothetical protein